MSEETGDSESRLAGPAGPGVLDEPISEKDWAGGIEEEMARVPSVRIGRRWVSTLWLIPVVVVGLLFAVAIAQQLREYSWMQSFIADFPGTSSSYAPRSTEASPGGFAGSTSSTSFS